MALKILLINPPYLPTERYGEYLSKLGPTTEPLGLAYIAAALEEEGHNVEIIDAPALRMNTSQITDRAAKGVFDVVGVTMLTPMYERSTEVIKAIRRVNSETKIIVGGAHSTILPMETLREHPEVDAVIIGEGEETVKELARNLEKGVSLKSVKGIAFRLNGQIVITEPRPYIKDLDGLPLPARHLLPMNAYRMTASRFQEKHSYTIIIGRGCPYNCTYCSHPLGHAFRHHSPERIINEIEFLIDEYGAEEINFETDTISVNKKFLQDLCRKIIESGLNRKIQWTCEDRVDTVDEDLLRLMKEAGCWQISYGVETASQRLLDLIEKGETIEQFENVFELTRRAGISIRAFFMLGLPTETREESLQTIAFAKKLDPDWAQFTITVPFPGTKLFEMATKEGSLESNDWSSYKTWGGWAHGDLAYVPNGRDQKELKELQKIALRSFYLSPKVILRFLRSSTSIKKINKYITGAYVLLRSYFIKD